MVTQSKMKHFMTVMFLMCLVALAQGRLFEGEPHDKAKEAPLLDDLRREAPMNDAEHSYLHRCNGQNNGCCTSNNPCTKGSGDCDKHKQCARDLICKGQGCEQRSGSFQPTDDCCVERKAEDLNKAQCYHGTFTDGFAYGGSWEWVNYMTDVNKCIHACAVRRRTNLRINGISFAKLSVYKSGGCYCVKNGYYLSKKTKDKTCYFPYLDASGLRCQGANNGCCTKLNPCGLHDGDCDHHDECAWNLYCGKNNCQWGKGDDCCIERHAGDEEVTMGEGVKDEKVEGVEAGEEKADEEVLKGEASTEEKAEKENADEEVWKK